MSDLLLSGATLLIVALAIGVLISTPLVIVTILEQQRQQPQRPQQIENHYHLTVNQRIDDDVFVQPQQTQKKKAKRIAAARPLDNSPRTNATN